MNPLKNVGVTASGVIAGSVASNIVASYLFQDDEKTLDKNESKPALRHGLLTLLGGAGLLFLPKNNDFLQGLAGGVLGTQAVKLLQSLLIKEDKDKIGADNKPTIIAKALGMGSADIQATPPIIINSVPNYVSDAFREDTYQERPTFKISTF